MKKIADNDKRNLLRKQRVKARIFRGGVNRERLSVFKSNKHVFIQIIDDKQGKTIVSASDHEIKAKDLKKMDIAKEVGKLIAKKALDNKIKKVVFDRNRYLYHGTVKAVADGAREGGLEI